MAAKGVFRTLDRGKIPNAKNISARFAHPVYDPKGTWSVPYQWGTIRPGLAQGQAAGLLPVVVLGAGSRKAARPRRPPGFDA